MCLITPQPRRPADFGKDAYFFGIHMNFRLHQQHGGLLTWLPLLPSNCPVFWIWRGLSIHELLVGYANMNDLCLADHIGTSHTKPQTSANFAQSWIDSCFTHVSWSMIKHDTCHKNVQDSMCCLKLVVPMFCIDVLQVTIVVRFLKEIRQAVEWGFILVPRFQKVFWNSLGFPGGTWWLV